MAQTDSVTVTLDVEYTNEIGNGWSTDRSDTVTQRFNTQDLDDWVWAYFVDNGPHFCSKCLGHDRVANYSETGWAAEIADGVWVVNGDSFEVDIDTSPARLLDGLGSLNQFFRALHSGRDNGTCKRLFWRLAQHHGIAEDIGGMELPSDDDERRDVIMQGL